MSLKLQVILFVCLAASAFWITNKNFLEENGKTAENQQNELEINQADNVVDNRVKEKKTISAAKKNRIKSSAKYSKVVELDESQLIDSLDSVAGTNESDSQLQETDLETPVSLWEQVESDMRDPVEGDTVVHEELIKTDSETLATVQVGQVLDFFVPQLGESFQSKVSSTSNQFGEVKVWKGSIEGEEENKSNFIMTRGEKMTHVVLSTSEGNYTVNIDNKTGEGTVVDDREYTSRMSDIDDSIPFYDDEPQAE